MDRLSDNLKMQMQIHHNDIRLLKQFVYDQREENDELHGSSDIASDSAIMKLEGLYHRYPTKVLLFPTESCFGECRFCFRKHIRQNKVISKEEFRKILDYIESNPEITEVIFSGGDPMVLGNNELFFMMQEIRKIPTVKLIRIHTRVLSYSPERLNFEFINMLKTLQPVFMVFHINSSLEIGDCARERVKELVDNGILCFSQTALLHEVNDTECDLKQLFVDLISLRIKPYYLFHPDRVKGNDHFYVPLNKGKELYKSLYNHISGLAMPLYLLNIPGGGGHCIIDLDNVKEVKEGRYLVKDWEGNISCFDE